MCPVSVSVAPVRPMPLTAIQFASVVNDVLPITVVQDESLYAS